MAKPKLLTILGPTGTGKTDLAILLAAKFGGEIICADSRTIYRYADIGTAKPTKDELMQIPHHLLDLIVPTESFSAAEFKLAAQGKIQEIARRGKLPVMVGGSGLYVDSVLFDYQFPAGARSERRQELEKMSTEELVGMLKEEDPEAAETVDLNNPRRVIRAIETAGMPRQKAKTMQRQTLALGLTLNKELLQKRLVQRAEKMLEQGIIYEVKRILARFGNDVELLNSPGYRAVKRHLAGELEGAELVEAIATEHMQMARRQMTWFRRHKDIVWLDAADAAALEIQAAKLAEDFLAS